MDKPKIYFGKISTEYPDQLTNNYYGGGKKGNSWYGGMEIGDYVFPIFGGKISKLWKLKGYEERPNPMNQEGVAEFELIREYEPAISVSNQFNRFNGFHLDLNLLNKCVKSTAKSSQGFFSIQTTTDCPLPANIEFANTRKIYITRDKPYKPISYQEGDLKILVSEAAGFPIQKIEVFKNGQFSQYDSLYQLYLGKNPADKRYSLTELLEYTKADKAPRKEKYLKAVIKSLKNDGYFLVTNPVKLYDNILVGRKRTFSKKQRKQRTLPAAPIISPDVIPEEDELITEVDYDAYANFVDLLNYNPNLILYGPPGTGKTYSIEKIIEAFEYERTNEVVSFSDLKEDGRISFVTFHQSFSYEEFIEGLRPVTISSDESSETVNNNLSYQVQSGILLQIANKAIRGQLQEDFTGNEFEQVSDTARIWKISLGSRGKEEGVYFDSISSNTISIGWLPDQDLSHWDKEVILEALKRESEEEINPTNDSDSIFKFVHELSIGDIVLIFASVNSIRAIGVINSDYYYDKLGLFYSHRRDVTWLEVFDEPVNILKYNNNVRLTLKTVYELTRFKFSDIKQLLTPKQNVLKKEDKPSIPYFLIIDEINRGNISKVFGELITLIEKDKRDKLEVELPYSRKSFTLPSNLYIIGTMNTADRSIAVLDTALRRRFMFKEMMPDSGIIRIDQSLNDDDIDLADLLDKLNVKITKKIDRDHRIGHSYFLNVLDLNELKIIWYYQIIPLLMEYFYNEGNEIAAIITDAFIHKDTCEIKWIASNEAFKQALLQIK